MLSSTELAKAMGFRYMHASKEMMSEIMNARKLKVPVENNRYDYHIKKSEELPKEELPTSHDEPKMTVDSSPSVHAKVPIRQVIDRGPVSKEQFVKMIEEEEREQVKKELQNIRNELLNLEEQSSREQEIRESSFRPETPWIGKKANRDNDSPAFGLGAATLGSIGQLRKSYPKKRAFMKPAEPSFDDIPTNSLYLNDHGQLMSYNINTGESTLVSANFIGSGPSEAPSNIPPAFSTTPSVKQEVHYGPDGRYVGTSYTQVPMTNNTYTTTTAPPVIYGEGGQVIYGSSLPQQMKEAEEVPGWLSQFLGEMGGAKEMVKDASIEGMKLVGAQEATILAREVLNLAANHIASSGTFMKYLGNTKMGKKIHARRMQHLSQSTLYRLGEPALTAVFGYLFAMLPFVPKKMRPMIIGATQRMVVVQAGQLAREFGSPALRGLIAAASTIPQLMAARMEEKNEGVVTKVEVNQNPPPAQ